MDQQVKVKVISVDKGKIGLSIKQLEKKKPSSYRSRPARPARPKQSFEDKLSKFLKDSEERQADVKSSFDKRGKRNNF